MTLRELMSALESFKNEPRHHHLKLYVLGCYEGLIKYFRGAGRYLSHG